LLTEKSAFAEATRRLLEGRGAIWEVLVMFDWLLTQFEAFKDCLKDIDYKYPDAPEHHLIMHVNLARNKFAQYYKKFNNMPVHYAATVLHPHYKNHLASLWKVPDTHISAHNSVHYCNGWLDNSHQAFLRIWEERSNAASM
jgi:hypothetical protein